MISYYYSCVFYSYSYSAGDYMVELHEYKRPITYKIGATICGIKMFCKYFIAYTMIFYGVVVSTMLFIMQYYYTASISLIIPFIGYKIITGIETCTHERKSIDFY